MSDMIASIWDERAKEHLGWAVLQGSSWNLHTEIYPPDTDWDQVYAEDRSPRQAQEVACYAPHLFPDRGDCDARPGFAWLDSRQDYLEPAAGEHWPITFCATHRNIVDGWDPHGPGEPNPYSSQDEQERVREEHDAWRAAGWPKDGAPRPSLPLARVSSLREALGGRR